MASPRPSLLAALALLAALTLGGGTPVLAASHSSHRSARAGHRARRCNAARRRRGHAGSVHQTHRPSGATGCRRRRKSARTHHAARTHRSSSALALPGAGGGCQDATLRPTPEDLARVREATLCLVNRERLAVGEAALRVNERLAQAAQAHTDDMVAADYFDHVDRSGRGALERMRSVGYVYSARIGYEIGENIAWGTGVLATPRAIVAAWMASPGHRANILDPRYRDTAVGVSSRLPSSLGHGTSGGIYTQDFGVLITA